MEEYSMNIYFTLDYELFLGLKTGTPENCLIRPMNELCGIADKYGFKYVVFVDSAYLLRLHTLRRDSKQLSKDYDKVVDHIRQLSAYGHDVQMHFHPQWLYSSWNDERKNWDLDQVHYKLSDMKYDFCKYNFKLAKSLLDEIIGYKTTVYRAGGFCLDNFVQYKDLFKECEIIIDSSVARNTKIKSKVHYYDYMKIPSKQIYRFEESVKIEEPNGSFEEYSISSFGWNPLLFFTKIRPLLTSFHPKEYFRDGEGISDRDNAIQRKLGKMIKKNYLLASIDGGQSTLLNVFYEKALLKGQNDLVFIGHPKNASDLSLRNLDNFASLLKGKAEIKTIGRK